VVALTCAPTSTAMASCGPQSVPAGASQ
jgi:hypothetical protein